MEARVGVGVGEDAYVIASEAAHEAVANLGVDAKAILVFSSVKYDQGEVLRGVRAVAPNVLVVGSSTSGEIVNSGPLKQHSVVVMAIGGENLVIRAGVGTDIASDANRAGADAARSVQEQFGDTPMKFFMMFPDILAGNGAEIVRGVKTVLGETFPVVGGASGDDFQFKKTYQYLNDEVHSGAIVGLGFGGDVFFGVGVKHGWVPIGLPRKVTKSKDSVVHELDGKPAISIYNEYFGEDEARVLKDETLARLAITYPLGVRQEGTNEYLIRDPLTVDEHGSITCAAEIPEGSEVQLMIGSRDEAIVVAERAAQMAKEQLDGRPPKAVIIFNCIARQKLFGENAGDEITRIVDVLGKDVPLAGFYTYGEQAPIDGQVRDIQRCNSQFHNETVVILVLA